MIVAGTFGLLICPLTCAYGPIRLIRLLPFRCIHDNGFRVLTMNQLGYNPQNNTFYLNGFSNCVFRRYKLGFYIMREAYFSR